MFTALTLLVSTIVAAVLSFLLSRRLLRASSSLALKIIIASSLIAGVALVLASSASMGHVFTERCWPVTEGTVIESDIAHDQTYRPQIAYSYTVSGVIYTDTTTLGAPGFGGKRKRYDVSRSLTHDHPVGSKIAIHYDPANPADSVPKTTITWDVYTKLSFGITLYAIGIFLSVGLIMGKGKSSASSSQTV
ncbi:MAG: DUF3592 domain-containing protein [Candidatus Zixiibacteriota bacterium]